MPPGSYALVCPYVGWLEAEQLARPYLHWAAAGAGFGAWLAGASLLGRWLQRRAA